MKKRAIPFFLTLFCLPVLMNAKIIETTEIKDILNEIDEQTLVLFDMDDTLTDSTISMGSGIWRQYMRKQLVPEYDIRSDQNPHDILAHRAASEVPVKPVEEDLVPLIHDLQSRQIAVFCLTKRGHQRWYSSTIEGIDLLSKQQLHSIGIDFSRSQLPDAFRHLDTTLFYHGIFLASGTNKGPFLENILNKTGYLPAKVIFVDDKMDDVKSVEETLNAMGIPNACYWYHRADSDRKNFNPLIASIQLQALLNDQRVPNDEEALNISEESAISDPDAYFMSIIKSLDKL